MRRFTQVFMPYKDIGRPKNASEDAAISLDGDDGSARIGVYLTSRREVYVMLHERGSSCFRRSWRFQGRYDEARDAFYKAV